MWEIFFFKNGAENESEGLALDLILHKVKQVVNTLIYIGRPSLTHTIKTNSKYFSLSI